MKKQRQEQELSFLNELGVQQIVQMYDLIPDTLFWIKNCESQIMYANRAFLENFNIKHLHTIVGKSDEYFSPPYLARQYIIDDQKVMAGELVTNRIELNIGKDGNFAWYSTSKRPLFDTKQNIIGSYGVTQHLERSFQDISTISAIQAPVDYIKEHYQSDISIEELAKLSFLSVSALERRFKKHLSKTPKQFINEIRLENARRMLTESQAPIMEIAYECGFAEHSYFSKQFKALFGILPSQLRKQVLENNKDN